MHHIRPYSFNLDVLLNTAFSINILKYVDCPREWQINQQVIPDYDLWYVKRGSGTLILNDEEYPIQPGCMYFFRPGDVISATQEPNNRLSVYYCHFQTEANWFFPRVQVQQGALVKPYRIELYLFQAVQLQGSGEFTSDDQQLMLVTVFHFLFKAGALRFILPGLSPLDYQRFEKAVEFMNQHIDQNLVVADMEEFLALEKSGINKLFRSITGMSTIHFFTNLRINKAKIMLRTGKRISHVAESLGYTDLFTFSKVFKRQTGMTPRSYAQHTFQSFE